MTVAKIQKPDAAVSFFTEWLRPKAAALDQETSALREALDEMAKRGLMGLKIPAYFGGKGIDDKSFRTLQETAARCSGAFAFLQAQHHSACAMVAQSQNTALREKVLPKMATGAIRSAIAFSQLRKPGRPLLSATPVADGYTLSGVAPWVTGWGLFTHCVTAAALPYGRTLFIIHELKETAHVKPTPPMKLAAFEATQTVQLKFTNYTSPPADTLFIQPTNWIQDNDLMNIALQAPFALGCARAGIDILREIYVKKKIDAAQAIAEALEKEFKICREETYAAMENRADTIRGLRARSWTIELAGRCAQAAMIASSGAGNLMENPAQRVYREAIVFSVSAQTQEIMEATLARFARK